MSTGFANNQATHSKGNRIFGQYLINNQFQFKFGLVLFAILATSTGVLWLEGHVAINRLIESELVKNDLLLEQLKLMNGIMGKTAVLISTFTFALALFLSHYIAGPIYRFEKTFEEMRNGNLTVIVRLRKNDQFQDVADTFNQALSSLRNKLKNEREETEIILNRAKKLAQSFNQAGHSSEAEQLEQMISELKKQSHQVKIS